MICKEVHMYNNYDELIELISESDREYNLDIINKAYEKALSSHGVQKRVSGVPYILHPVSVACILAELGMDTESIVAALLHDVVEDTPVTRGDIETEFGKEISALVEGVTKLGKIHFSSREEQQAENIRKMLIAMAKDIRVIIIKLADRVQNMRTIACMPEQKRRDKSLENMEVFAPIAHRLGIRNLKEELEDLSLKYLDPIAYDEIEHSLNLKRDQRIKFLDIIKVRIKERLNQYMPNVYIEGRVKSANGIYRKVYIKGSTMDEVYDIYAVRVIVGTVNDCYNVLGIIHEMFKPIPNRFKDYISIPKPNMYQSLHTTVLSKEGIPFEVQIRTRDMHHTAEYGIAAHWKYKLGISNTKDSLEKRISWIRKMLDGQNECSDAIDIIRNIKLDLAPEEVFVLTPKGGVITLPIGATVVDFAYAIHTEIGNRMIGAKVDKRIVPIDYAVKTGEIIEIITTKDIERGPSRDWLNIVRTGEAKNKIKQWFRREKREENIAEGKMELEKEFRRNGISFTDDELIKALEPIMKRNQCKALNDFFAIVGYGGLQIWRVMPRLKDEHIKLKGTAKDKPEKEEEEPQKLKLTSGVEIDGIDNCLVHLSKCCDPLPGDPIIGFITRGYGVSIHKRGCANVPKYVSESSEPGRWISAHWLPCIRESFKATLEVESENNESLLSELINQLYNMRLPISTFSSKVIDENRVTIFFSISVRDLHHLRSVINTISRISGIKSVKRV